MKYMPDPIHNGWSYACILGSLQLTGSLLFHFLLSSYSLIQFHSGRSVEALL